MSTKAGRDEALIRARALHKQAHQWWKDSAKLESQGKKIPASTLRQRMQTFAWGLKAIEEALSPTERES